MTWVETAVLCTPITSAVRRYHICISNAANVPPTGANCVRTYKDRINIGNSTLAVITCSDRSVCSSSSWIFFIHFPVLIFG